MPFPKATPPAMREMLRCLVCGRNAWPTSYAKGQKHGHSIDTLVLVKSRGRARGIQWRKSSRDKDRDYLIMWRDLMMAHLDRIELALEMLGQVFEDAPEEVVQPETISRESAVARSVHPVRWSPAVRRPSFFIRQAPVIKRG